MTTYKGPGGALFCGCCGNEILPRPRTDRDWCKRCDKHVGKGGAAPWNRTYHAVHGEQCPFYLDRP